MEIKINAVGFSASSQLEDFIQKKISKLDNTTTELSVRKLP